METQPNTLVYTQRFLELSSFGFPLNPSTHIHYHTITHTLSHTLPLSSPIPSPRCIELEIKRSPPPTIETLSRFAAALKADSSVRRLELDDNALGTAGLLKIAEAIGARNVDLLSLQITSNAIGDEGVEALADFLGRSSALRTLKLGGNGLSDAAAAILADVIPPSLHELDLSNNNIGDNGFLSLLHACADTLVGCGHSKCGPGHDTTFSTRASSFIPFPRCPSALAARD